MNHVTADLRRYGLHTADTHDSLLEVRSEYSCQETRHAAAVIGSRRETSPIRRHAYGPPALAQGRLLIGTVSDQRMLRSGQRHAERFSGAQNGPACIADAAQTHRGQPPVPVGAQHRVEDAVYRIGTSQTEDHSSSGCVIST